MERAVEGLEDALAHLRRERHGSPMYTFYRSAAIFWGQTLARRTTLREIEALEQEAVIAFPAGMRSAALKVPDPIGPAIVNRMFESTDEKA